MLVSSRVHCIIDQLMESEGFEDFEFDFGVPSIVGVHPVDFHDADFGYFVVTFDIGRALSVGVGTTSRIHVLQRTRSGRLNQYMTILRLPPELRTQHNSLRKAQQAHKLDPVLLDTWINDVTYWLNTDQLVYRRLIGYLDIYGYSA